MESQKMDRSTDACKAHLSGATRIDIRQTRRGWCQEILGCEAKSEFRYYNSDKQEIAHSLEDSECCCRFFCMPIHPFVTTVKELNTEAELLTVDRPCACCPGPCKCCCYQTSTFTSGGASLGRIHETFYCCIPTYKIIDAYEKEIYTVHPPTCLGGCCVDCFAEGNPCGKGCCKASFRFFPADQQSTNGDAPYVGQVLKKPKSAMTEIFTDANAFEVHFPSDATADQKAVVVGTALFLNAVHFETDNSQ